MDKIKEAITKYSAFWFTISAFLVTLANQGVPIPDWALSLFSEDFVSIISGAVDAVFVAIGALTGYWSALRALFAVNLPAEAVVSLSSQNQIIGKQWAPWAKTVKIA